jgi:hypothetical protein
MNASQRRLAVRDRWQADSVATRAAVVLDWTLGVLLAASIMLAGSLNL